MTYYDDGLVKWIIDKNYYNCVCVKQHLFLLIKLLSFDTSSSKEEITSVTCFRLDTFHIKMNVLIHIKTNE